ncbi:DUF6868 family protein [uncultured Shimia sp.]|uniref:DUF6868 family protein n=1 Tax=uncultured Shimia sp. TaxID=573152 RepID=UPI00263112B5|nr:hypothetical protein [uncultured Shimia sp.]
MTYESLTAFFGWMTVLNFGFLALAGLGMLGARGWATRLHARMFNLDATDVSMEWYRFLAQWKILTIVFALTPYLALRLAG